MAAVAGRPQEKLVHSAGFATGAHGPSARPPPRLSPRAEAFRKLQGRTVLLHQDEAIWESDAAESHNDNANKAQQLDTLQRLAARKVSQLRRMAEDLATMIHDQPAEDFEHRIHLLSETVKMCTLDPEAMYKAEFERFSEMAKPKGSPRRPSSASARPRCGFGVGSSSARTSTEPAAVMAATGALTSRLANSVAKSRWLGVAAGEKKKAVIAIGRAAGVHAASSEAQGEKAAPSAPTGEGAVAALPPSLFRLISQLNSTERAMHDVSAVCAQYEHMLHRDELLTEARRKRNERVEKEFIDVRVAAGHAWSQMHAEVSASHEASNELGLAVRRHERNKSELEERRTERTACTDHAAWWTERLKLTPKEQAAAKAAEATSSAQAASGGGASGPIGALLASRPTEGHGAWGGGRALDYSAGGGEVGRTSHSSPRPSRDRPSRDSTAPESANEDELTEEELERLASSAGYAFVVKLCELLGLPELDEALPIVDARITKLSDDREQRSDADTRVEVLQEQLESAQEQLKEAKATAAAFGGGISDGGVGSGSSFRRRGSVSSTGSNPRSVRRNSIAGKPRGTLPNPPPAQVAPPAPAPPPAAAATPLAEVPTTSAVSEPADDSATLASERREFGNRIDHAERQAARAQERMNERVMRLFDVVVGLRHVATIASKAKVSPESVADNRPDWVRPVAAGGDDADTTGTPAGTLSMRDGGSDERGADPVSLVRDESDKVLAEAIDALELLTIAASDTRVQAGHRLMRRNSLAHQSRVATPAAGISVGTSRRTVSGRSLHALGSSFSAKSPAAAAVRWAGAGAADDASVDDATDDGSEVLDATDIKWRAKRTLARKNR